jgi:hypothetical protein
MPSSCALLSHSLSPLALFCYPGTRRVQSARAGRILQALMCARDFQVGGADDGLVGLSYSATTHIAPSCRRLARAQRAEMRLAACWATSLSRFVGRQMRAGRVSPGKGCASRLSDTPKDGFFSFFAGSTCTRISDLLHPTKSCRETDRQELSTSHGLVIRCLSGPPRAFGWWGGRVQAIGSGLHSETAAVREDIHVSSQAAYQ